MIGAHERGVTGEGLEKAKGERSQVGGSSVNAKEWLKCWGQRELGWGRCGTW